MILNTILPKDQTIANLSLSLSLFPFFLSCLLSFFLSFFICWEFSLSFLLAFFSFFLVCLFTFFLSFLLTQFHSFFANSCLYVWIVFAWLNGQKKVSPKVVYRCEFFWFFFPLTKCLSFFGISFQKLWLFDLMDRKKWECEI